MVCHTSTFLAGFYRTMCMHSADYAVELTVYQSHAGIVLRLNILNFFSPSGSHAHHSIAFPHQTM